MLLVCTCRRVSVRICACVNMQGFILYIYTRTHTHVCVHVQWFCPATANDNFFWFCSFKVYSADWLDVLLQVFMMPSTNAVFMLKCACTTAWMQGWANLWNLAESLQIPLTPESQSSSFPCHQIICFVPGGLRAECSSVQELRRASCCRSRVLLPEQNAHCTH